MNQCPKCNSFNIHGPTYFQNVYVENLSYRCMRCGYTSSKPCADHKSQKDIIKEKAKKLMEQVEHED